MGALQIVESAHSRGRYLEALHALDQAKVSATDGVQADLWRMELSERVGLYDESRAVAERLLANSRLPLRHRAACEAALGRIAADSGATTIAVLHLQKAARGCDKTGDLILLCWIQLRLVAVLAESSGQQAAAVILGDLRRNAMKVGDPVISAAVHVYVAQMEGKRGLVANAVKHSLLAQQLLGAEEHQWLQGMAETTLTAAAIMCSDYDKALLHGTRALSFAEASGAAVLRRSALNNLGHVHFQLGNFAEATRIFERCQSSRPASGPSKNGVWDCLAQVCLLQDRIGEAGDYLSRIHVQSDDDWRLYPNRHSKLTFATWHRMEGRYTEALECCDAATQLAGHTGDRALLILAALARMDVLQDAGRIDDSHAVLAEMAPFVRDLPPLTYAEYERTVGRVLLQSGHRAAGTRHLRRAHEIYSALHSVPGMQRVDRTLIETLAPPLPTPSRVHDGAVDADSQAAAGVLQQISSLLLQAGQPEILATRVMALLATTGCVSAAVARSRNGDDANTIIASFGRLEDRAEHQTLPLGSSGYACFEVVLQPKGDIESRVTLSALGTLLGTVRELEASRLEGQQRLSLWPADDVPVPRDGIAVAGTMAAVNHTVQQVAPMNVLVLITGESGTGKEVLARSIHQASPRAAKPFVPFNCAAIPRELLESQLFGYRRGAFTGADRDSPGVIRAAQNGTLFLDEIGELSLDLQPKLLRFLERSEINPLGDATPSRVDVRIIAATNANLDALVAQGKFREDLFYRLNVIQVPIPPLRERRDEIPSLVHHFVERAAHEFGKGRIRISDEAMEHFLLFDWPGNVRQLQNEIRRMVALAEFDAVLRPTHVASYILRATPKPPEGNSESVAVSLRDDLPTTITRIERGMIERALKEHEGKVDAVARALGISRKGLYLKRQRHGI